MKPETRNLHRLMKHLFTLLVVSLSVATWATDYARGQGTASTERIQQMEEMGHTHLSARTTLEEVIVGFQNRRHRDEGRAVHDLLTVLDSSERDRALSITGRARGLDMYRVVASDGVTDVRPTRAGGADSSPFLVDLVIHPFFSALLGSYSQPVRARAGVAPELALYPWRGGKISAQVELIALDDVSRETRRIAPGLISISQWLRIPVGYTYASAGAGLFSHERYGVAADVQSLFFDGRLALHGSVAHTGFAALESSTWYISSLNRMQALAGVEYVHPRLAASVLVRGGVFIDGDEGVRVDVRRAFGAFQIGFFGLATTLDNTAGVSVRIPLFPARHSSAPARVVPGSHLPIAYRYNAGGGRIMRTGYEIDLFENQLHPAVVAMQLRRAQARR